MKTPVKNNCEYIANFYQAALADSKVIATESTGPFGGKTVSYTLATESGPVKVECDSGIDTLFFTIISITTGGFVSGHIGKDGGRIGSQGSHFFATNVSPVKEDGTCEIKTLFTNAVLHLPKP